MIYIYWIIFLFKLQFFCIKKINEKKSKEKIKNNLKIIQTYLIIVTCLSKSNFNLMYLIQVLSTQKK